MNACMKFPNTISEFIDDYKFKDSKKVYTNGSELISVFRVKQALEHYTCQHPKWISVEERLPPDFVSVIAHMTDAEEFPSVREAYAVCGGLKFFFPALRECHPVDYWMEMPELPKEE